MKAPVLLADRPPAGAAVLTTVVPLVFGAICGAVLSASKAGYLVLIVLSLVGGFLGGMEHDDVLEGVWRGLLGGLLFGTGLLVAFDEIGNAAKTNLPDPHSLIVLLSAVVGMGLGAAGAASRRRRGRRT